MLGAGRRGKGRNKQSTMQRCELCWEQEDVETAGINKVHCSAASYAGSRKERKQRVEEWSKSEPYLRISSKSSTEN